MSETKSTIINLFQWNTLNRQLSDKKAFPYVDDKYLVWEYRHPLIKKIIEENKSDIICLEEVSFFDEDFKQKMFETYNTKYDLIFEARTSKFMGNVLGVNKELFSIEKHENIVLDGPDGKPSGQNMIVALINDKKTNSKFMVIVVHLKAKAENENIRLGQIDHLMKYIEEKLLGKYPLFILGDFNAEPTYSCILKLLENKKINAKSLFDFNELGFSTIKLRDKLYKRIIDYIFFVPKEKDGKDKELKILTAEKAKPTIDEKIGLPNDVFPSDHLFLKAKVELNFV